MPQNQTTIYMDYKEQQSKHFSRLLRSKLAEKNWTVAKLQKEFELKGFVVNVGTLYAWIKGKTLPSSVMQLLLVDILSISSDELIGVKAVKRF